MSKIHFIDASVLSELLNIPGMNDRHSIAKQEYQELVRNGDTFILPVAVLVETGNHIAHIANGNSRRSIAKKFTAIAQKAIKMEDNWSVTPEIPRHILEVIVNQFPDQAVAETGFGDLSIIAQFNDYWENRQPIGEMRIWSYDSHLSGYIHIGGLSRRKNK